MIGLILSSSAIAAVVSSVCSYFIQRSALARSYKQDYYKMIIGKRMEAYQYVEAQIAVLKMAVVDDRTGEGYHMIFNYEDSEYQQYQSNLRLALTHSMWLSENMIKALAALNQLFLTIDVEINQDVMHNISVGKKYYTQLASARTDVENNLKTDLLTLYDVKNFLNKKTEKKYRRYMIPKRK